MNSIVEDILMHYGMPRRSGRYPYGSGENPYQHSGDFLSRVQELKKSGMSETDIAKNMGLTTTQLRTQMSLAKDERRALQVATAKGLREKGYSLNEIADKMRFANDSSVRSLLNETSENRMNQAKATADVLRKLIEEKGMIDVGTGVERELGVSKEDVIEMESRMTGADVGFDLPTDDDDEAYVPSLYLEDKSSNFAAELESENFEEQATEKLGTALANLDERSQEIIKARWLDDEKATLHDLAAKYNVSAERIRQLEANALKKLKSAVDF